MGSEAAIARIDRDRDGAFSADEKAAYVSDVMSTIVLRVGDHPVVLPSPSAEFPDAVAFRNGEGTIRLSSTIALPRVSNGAHVVSFRNDHHPGSSVYLANTLAPDGDQILIERQTRDLEQRTLTIDYTVGGERFATLPVWLFGSGAAGWLLFRARRLSPSR